MLAPGSTACSSSPALGAGVSALNGGLPGKRKSSAVSAGAGVRTPQPCLDDSTVPCVLFNRYIRLDDALPAVPSPLTDSSFAICALRPYRICATRLRAISKVGQQRHSSAQLQTLPQWQTQHSRGSTTSPRNGSRCPHRTQLRAHQSLPHPQPRRHRRASRQKQEAASRA